jgi:hypothetical protein
MTEPREKVGMELAITEISVDPASRIGLLTRYMATVSVAAPFTAISMHVLEVRGIRFSLRYPRQG